MRLSKVFVSLVVVGAVVIAGLVTTQPTSAQTRKDSFRDQPAAAPARDPEKTAVTPPQYQIVDIGVVVAGDSAAQAFGISPNNIATGRSVRTGGAQTFSWTQAGGIVGLPNLAGSAFCVGNSVNDSGVIVGLCGTSLFGSNRLPVIWQGGVATQLPLPAGETLGDANGVNASGVAVGSVNAGISQHAVIYSGGVATPITQTTTGGSFFQTAFGINNSGRIVGPGIDPNNAARNVGMVYDIGSQNAFEVGALNGANGAIPFGISNAGHVVGSSMMNQGSGLPFIWTQATGMVAIPLAAGTSQGSARAVNSAGWTVGTDSSAFAIPFLFDGTTTYRLADLIPAGTGWDLSTNTSSSALGISDSKVIVGTGVFNGQIHGYAMLPVVTNPSLSGRVLTAGGAGIRNTQVTVTGGGLPAPITTFTGSFGYFFLTGLQSGQTYTVTVTAKRFTFAVPSRMVTPSADVANFDFTADP